MEMQLSWNCGVAHPLELLLPLVPSSTPLELLLPLAPSSTPLDVAFHFASVCLARCLTLLVVPGWLAGRNRSAAKIRTSDGYSVADLAGLGALEPVSNQRHVPRKLHLGK